MAHEEFPPEPQRAWDVEWSEPCGNGHRATLPGAAEEPGAEPGGVRQENRAGLEGCGAPQGGTGHPRDVSVAWRGHGRAFAFVGNYFRIIRTAVGNPAKCHQREQAADHLG